MMKLMRAGKKLTVVTLVVFTVLTLYLCPCSFAEPVSGLQITKAQMHDCCEGMSECPLQHQNAPGLNSFLDSFSHDANTLQFFDSIQKLLEPVLLPVLNSSHAPINFSPHLEIQVFKSNPPDLFIQFQALLI
ncbi:MAG: hypothetical protein COW12_01315 [Candidatus Omnitrophica bacterium CG12_big_fil_rev_8_21_14_0_65_45_16]|nr:MAG: hypothetical protein COW12_01315 [Candidatus Omnitrophica bacterium CG12_big_fil_rev_8_21_14_0_65_45_16]